MQIPEEFKREGVKYQLQVGDKALYDQVSGVIMFCDKEGVVLEFLWEERGIAKYVHRHFVGKDWPTERTKAFLMLSAASNGLKGKAERVEGSLPTLQTFAIVS